LKGDVVGKSIRRQEAGEFKGRGNLIESKFRGTKADGNLPTCSFGSVKGGAKRGPRTKKYDLHTEDFSRYGKTI